MMQEELVLTVSQFIDFANQTLEYAYPSIVITGELANFRVSKNRWVYFDLKDEESSLRFFGTVYNLNGPLEDGMMLKVRGAPRLHKLYGFSVTIQQIELVGEGTIKRAASLLEAKLAAEGLFALERKRSLPYPPRSIGLITSKESAAYADFTKILNARWGGINITLANVQVQGADSPQQLTSALKTFNELSEPPEVLVMIRGGGSPDDLQAFSNELVVRAVAASRIPTLVAIGHEIDVSLAELAADMRASTPSNAAELLVPDKRHIIISLQEYGSTLHDAVIQKVERNREVLERYAGMLDERLQVVLDYARRDLQYRRGVMEAYNPELALARGYAILRQKDAVVRSASEVKKGDIVDIDISDARLSAEVRKILPRKRVKNGHKNK